MDTLNTTHNTRKPLSLSQLRKYVDSESIGHHIWVKDFSLSNIIAATLDSSSDFGIYAVVSSDPPYYTEKNYGVIWVAYDAYTFGIESPIESTGFSRKNFMQQFTEIFSKNNKEQLEICLKEIASELDIADAIDEADIIDKAVFAAFYEICSGQVLSSNKTIKTIVEEHFRSILSK